VTPSHQGLRVTIGRGLWRGLCALFLMASGMSFAASAAQDEVQLLTQAQAVFYIDGHPSAQRATSLPLHWDIAMPGRAGRVDLEMAFERGIDPAGKPWSVLIPRLGNAWRIEVNGHLIQQAGGLDEVNQSWSAKRPVRIQIPAALLAQHNILKVSLRADIGRRAGLSRVTVGPTQDLRQQWLWQEWVRVYLPQAASVLSLLVACFAGLLWWQQREQLYAAAAVGELAWGLRLADTWWEASPLAWPAWGLAVLALFWIWSAAVYLLVRAVWDGVRPRLEQTGIAVVILSGPAAYALALGLQVSTPVVAWMAASLTAWWWLCLRLGMDAWRAPQWARWLMVLALTSCVAALTRDIYAGRASALLFEEPAWSKYAAVTMAVLVLLIVSIRFQRARQDLLALNRSIRQRIEDRERELHAQHLRVLQLESEKATAAERTRILRDMHDGAGANLIAAIRQVESGQATRAELLQTLGESLDQLRLSVDAMGLPAGDINALLANLRFRLDRRIRAAGLTLIWRADALPILPWCSSACMRHIQFILMEAISNVMQHAKASHLTMTATAEDGAIVIALRDDGQGLDGQSGNGLRSMQERAASLQATLTLEPAGPGLRVRLRLPDVPPASP
jgi:signal transduction histidine kinase